MSGNINCNNVAAIEKASFISYSNHASVGFKSESKYFSYSDTANFKTILTIGDSVSGKVRLGMCDNSATNSYQCYTEWIFSTAANSAITITEIASPINNATYGLTYQWVGKELQVKPKNSFGNQFVVAYDVLGYYDQMTFGS